jgi:hypothetical protein
MAAVNPDLRDPAAVHGWRRWGDCGTVTMMSDVALVLQARQRREVEAAARVGISKREAERLWMCCHAWLRKEMGKAWAPEESWRA